MHRKFDNSTAVSRRRNSILKPASVPLAIGLFAASIVRAGSSVSYTGTTYTQTFDGLQNPGATDVNASNTPTISSIAYTLPTVANTPFEFDAPIASGGLNLTSLPGWYGNGSVKDEYGAQAGSMTTGGVIDFGAANTTDRSLGLMGTSTSGVTSFGLELINNESVSLNQITLNYAGELWHQGTTAKSISAAYAITSASAGMPLTGTTALPASYTVSNSPVGASVQSTQSVTPLFNASFGGTNTQIATWAPGTALWITWTINSSSGSGQGFSIDNLSFSASVAAGSNIAWNTTSGTWNTSAINWLGGSPTVGAYREGDFVTFGNISTSSLVTIGNGGGVTPGSTTITNAANTYTFSGGSINGSGSLTMNGSGGTAILSAANNYSGGTFVTAGKLVANGDNTLGIAGGSVTFNGGTLQAGAAINSNRSISVSGTTGTSTFATGGLNSITSGTLTAGALLTVTGLANTGGLEVDGTVAFTGAGALNISNGATVTFGQTSGTINQVNNSSYNGKLIATGPIRLNFNGISSGGTATSPGTVTAGIISGSGKIDIANPGTVASITIPASKKVAAITYNGNPTTAIISNTSSTQGGQINVPIVLNSGNQYSSGGTFSRFDVTQAIESPGNSTVTLGGTNGSSSTDPSIQDGYGIIINAPISGNSDVNIANSAAGGGSGYLVLNASSTYAGATLINTADLTQIGVKNALPAGTDLVFGTIPNAVGGGTILDLNGFNQTVASLSSGTFGTHKNQITNNGSVGSTLIVSGSVTPALPFEGEILDGLAASVSLVKSGSGGLMLSGANSYSGPTNVSGGTLTLTSTGTLASGSYLVANHATLILNGNFNSLSPAAVANAVPDIATAGTTIIGPSTSTTGPMQISTGALSITSTGTFTVTDPSVGNHANRTLLVTNTLSLSGSTGTWTGLLDLAGNDMVIHNGSLADVTSQIKLGYNGGGLQGSSGIISSTAAQDTAHLTALGVIQNTVTPGVAIYTTGASGVGFDGATTVATDLLIKYTYYGDTNLDGKVDGSDYSRIDNGFSQSLTGWFNGDFNYDGTVDGSDYTLIDNAFNAQGSSLADEIATPTSQISAETTTAVPEPSGIFEIGLTIIGLLGRRRGNAGKRLDSVCTSPNP